VAHEFQKRNWFMDIAPAKRISMRNIVILADLPHIPRRMPAQCISLYHSLFMVLL
jgi:hypothetical protein